MAESRQSRCSVRQTPDLEWRSYRDEKNHSVAAVGAWLSSLNEYQRESAIGDILALRDQAAAGQLVEGDEDDFVNIKPVRRDPDLFELRWSLFGKHLRQYHAEPKRFPRLLVDLHLHIKHIDYKSRRRTTRAQEIEISYALFRYRVGDSQEWL